MRKEFGGLVVRRLREFNIALLGKWCWRMLVDSEGLWFRVLEARYKVEKWRLRLGAERVFMVEGDCKDSEWGGRYRWTLVWGVCYEEGGRWDGDILLD
jgi:hypothetical protein